MPLVRAQLSNFVCHTSTIPEKPKIVYRLDLTVFFTFCTLSVTQLRRVERVKYKEARLATFLAFRRLVVRRDNVVIRVTLVVTPHHLP